MMARLRENIGLRLLSLGLAFVLWTIAQGKETYQTTVVAPVEYLLPENLVLLNDAPPPDQVVIRASGSRAALRSLQAQLRESPARYVVDLEDSEPGRTVHSFRKLPRGVGQGVTIDTISPAEVELAFDAIARRPVPVLLRTSGKLPPGFVEAARSVQPAEVTLVGAASELVDLEFVQTLPVRLATLKTTFSGPLGLDLGDLHLTDESPREVHATLEVAEAKAEREFGVVPISTAIPGVQITPSACVVRLGGPVPVLDALTAGAIHGEFSGDPSRIRWKNGRATVGWSAEDGKAPAVRVHVDHPRAAELSLLEVEPAAFEVAPIEGPEPGPASEPPHPAGASAP